MPCLYQALDYREQLKYLQLSPKNQEAYDDWHTWVTSLSPKEKGEETPIYWTISTRFDITLNECSQPIPWY